MWGIGIGFAIVAAGTLLGELCTYLCVFPPLPPSRLLPSPLVSSHRADGAHSVFRYFCTARARKSEEKSVKYALIAEVIREGGLKMAIMVRFSTIPGHCASPLLSPSSLSALSLSPPARPVLHTLTRRRQ